MTEFVLWGFSPAHPVPIKLTRGSAAHCRREQEYRTGLHVGWKLATHKPGTEPEGLRLQAAQANPATPAVAIGNILAELGVPRQDFNARKTRGGCTLVSLFSATAEAVVFHKAEEVERRSRACGYPFRVTVDEHYGYLYLRDREYPLARRGFERRVVGDDGVRLVHVIPTPATEEVS